MAQFARKYSKKMNKQSNRDAFQGEVDAFLGNLEQPDRPEASRIGVWSTKYVETTAQRNAGIAILRVQVQLYSSLLAIVIDTTGRTADEVLDEVAGLIAKKQTEEPA